MKTVHIQQIANRYIPQDMCYEDVVTLVYSSFISNTFRLEYVYS